MHTTNKAIGFWSAVSMGIGDMVGAGIFAKLVLYRVVPYIFHLSLVALLPCSAVIP